VTDDAPVQRALIVGAHPDDPEFSSGGTIALWAQQGIEVTIALTTNGNKGTSDLKTSSERLAVLRRQEQLDAAKASGVKEVVFLDNNDCELVNNLELREQIVRLIRTYRPDVVLTHDPRTITLGGRSINHPDHRATGQATLDAIFPTARDPLNFPQHLKEGLLPHKVFDVYLWGAEDPNTWVDITEAFDLKVAAIRCHKTQVREPEAVEKRVRERSARVAEGHGMELAEAFYRIQLPR